MQYLRVSIPHLRLTVNVTTGPFSLGSDAIPAPETTHVTIAKELR